jgi:pantothenate kinase-related protein Tda10
MTSVICDAFKLEGKSCVAMSLDDFYLTGPQQEQLAKRYPKNDLLQYRGNGQSLVVLPQTDHVLNTYDVSWL